jgi:tRNA G18 (ribose-2'-O)-methylase SpoU
MSRLPIILIADNIRSLYNVGSLFRLADGVNVEAIYLCGLTGYPKTANDDRPSWVADRADKEIRKTGLSGVDSVPFEYFSDTVDACKTAKQAGYQLIALEKTEASIDYRTPNYHFPLAIIIGHETEGVADDILKLVDVTVELPMRGEGASLNVSTAAAAYLYYLDDRYESSQDLQKP